MEAEREGGEVLLSVEHLSVSFTRYGRGWKQKKLMAVRDLNLEVKAGELVAVVGSSGSGKSLLAHGIMGLLPYNASWEGKVMYRNQALTQERLKKLRGNEMVLVPQSVSYLDPLMKVGDQVRKGFRDPQSRKKCREVLARYGLGEEAGKLYPFERSGGMVRRILISTAVQERPRLVIADEPTPGLHMEAAVRVMGHFQEIAKEGAGVLVITHDLDLALKVADRIVVFYAGTNLEEAAAGDFRDESRLRHPYTKALYRAMPQNGFCPVPGSQPYGEDLPKGCVFWPRCELAEGRCQKPVPYSRFRGGMVRCWKAAEGVCEKTGSQGRR